MRVFLDINLNTNPYLVYRDIYLIFFFLFYSLITNAYWKIFSKHGLFPSCTFQFSRSLFPEYLNGAFEKLRRGGG